MIILYTVSCVYHALSRRTAGKRVLRVIDHCTVFLLVWCTYLPVSLLGVGGSLGWLLAGGVLLFAAAGMVLNAVSVEKFKIPSVLCQLACGWSVLAGIGRLKISMGPKGVLALLLGGALYSFGAVLYGLGAKKRYMHAVFHLFCLAGTACHFWAVYAYLL
jgi:hemolysin III